jgi:hypothetical protein
VAIPADYSRERVARAATFAFDRCVGNETTEQQLSEILREELIRADFFPSGWYQPPPHGTSVLSGEAVAGGRTTYGSLRDEENWSSDKPIDWDTDLLYFYTSPVDRNSGTIHDLASTIYFGNDEDILEHIELCDDVVNAAANLALEAGTSDELYGHFTSLLTKHSLTNPIDSQTSQTATNLGHCITSLTEKELDIARNEGDLNGELCDALSKSRQFIDDATSWSLDDQVFTVEPRFIDVKGLFPMISYHYVVDRRRNLIFREGHDLLRTLGEEEFVS